MKKQILNKLLIAILGIALIACGGGETKTDQADNTKTDNDVQSSKIDTRKMVKLYLKLKDALVNSDINSARITAKSLGAKSGDDIRGKAEGIYKSEDLKVQRQLFSEISQSLYNQLKAKGTPMIIHWQFCPMAFDNKGAYWLSEDKAIKNPYFGDEMMNCGSVKETLAVK